MKSVVPIAKSFDYLYGINPIMAALYVNRR